MAGVVADKTAADYFVSSLPGAPEPLLKMHAGYVTRPKITQARC